MSLRLGQVVNIDSTVPLYRQLSELLRSQVLSGEFTPGQRLPSEAQLGEKFGISRITIRQALGNLEREGIVTRVPGKGTFVAEHPSQIEGLPRLSSFSEDAAAAGRTAGYRLLDVGIREIPAPVQQALALSTPQAFVVERVLLADNAPVGVHRSHVPPWAISRGGPGTFTSETLGQGSLYRMLESTGIELYRAIETFTPGLISVQHAGLLDLEENALVQMIERVVFDRASERPVLCEHDIYRPDSYTHRVQLYNR